MQFQRGAGLRLHTEGRTGGICSLRLLAPCPALCGEQGPDRAGGMQPKRNTYRAEAAHSQVRGSRLKAAHSQVRGSRLHANSTCPPAGSGAGA